MCGRIKLFGSKFQVKKGLMSDVHSPSARSRNMSAIRGKDTKPEMLIRRVLHARGFRYRLHSRKLPGSPDLVFPKYHAVILIHGCFWHMHECEAFRWPSSRAEWWRDKLMANHVRDLRNVDELQKQGWRVAIVWECSLRGKVRLSEQSLASALVEWLRSDVRRLSIPHDV